MCINFSAFNTGNDEGDQQMRMNTNQFLLLKENCTRAHTGPRTTHTLSYITMRLYFFPSYTFLWNEEMLKARTGRRVAGCNENTNVPAQKITHAHRKGYAVHLAQRRFSQKNSFCPRQSSRSRSPSCLGLSKRWISSEKSTTKKRRGSHRMAQSF